MDHKPKMTATLNAFAAGRKTSLNAEFLNWKILRPGVAYLFSFAANGGRETYLVVQERKPYYYYVRKRRGKRYRRYRRRGSRLIWTVTRHTLDATATRRLAAGCSYEAPRGCELFRGLYKKLAAKLPARAELRALYTPRFDPSYDVLLGRAAGAAGAYFYGVGAATKTKETPRPARLYAGRGCLNAAKRRSGVRSRDFAAAFAGGRFDPASIWFWPARLDTVSRARRSAVYLRRFRCGSRELRFWDMERYSSQAGPGLVIYARRDGEPELDRAFSRHFAEKGTPLLETGDARAFRHVRAALAKTRRAGEATALAFELLRELRRKNPSAGAPRLILPSAFD